MEVDLKVKRPCANCPFLKEGAIELRPGRVEQICNDLSTQDRTIFLCHKTLHRKRKPSACMGALAWGWKVGRLPVSARFALLAGLLSAEKLESFSTKIIDHRPKE